MRINKDQITITLEDEQEIEDFWNVIQFALDFHAKETEAGRSCMAQTELALAKKLVAATKKEW